MQPLQALTKVFVNEEKSIRFLNLDFEENADRDFIGRTVVDELLTMDRNIDVCFRNERRFVKDFEKISIKQCNSNYIKDMGTYIITGGGSNIGIKIAEFISKKAPIRIALIGRKEEPSKNIYDAIAQIEKAGSTAEYFSCDVTDFIELEKVVNKIETNFGAVNGIFHCAGIKDDSMLQNKDFSAFKKVLSPKVEGLLNFEKIFSNKPIEFILLVSSISSYFCNQGQSDYSVANCFYNSYAKSTLNKSNKRVVSLCLPLINGGGMKSTDVVLKRMNKYGILQVELEDVIEAIEVALSDKSINTFCVIKSINPDLRIIPGVYRNKIKCYNKIGKSEILCNINNKNGCNNLMLDDAEKVEKYKERVDLKVMDLMCKLLIMDPAELDDNVNLGDYGMDSMLIKEATILFEREFDIAIESSIFLEYPNVAALSEYLSDKLVYSKSDIVGMDTAEINSEEELNTVGDSNKPVVLDSDKYKKQGLNNNLFNIIIDKFAKGDIDINNACNQIIAQIGKESNWEELEWNG